MLRSAEAVAIYPPDAWIARSDIGSLCGFHDLMRAPVSKRWCLQVVLRDAETIDLPSGLIAIAVMGSESPVNVLITVPVAISTT